MGELFIYLHDYNKRKKIEKLKIPKNKSTKQNLQASMNNFLDLTQFTLHFTTPMERARTSFHHFHFMRSITSSATHQITAIDTNRCIITLTPICTLDAHFCTPCTEVWRWLQIDEIFTTGWFMFRIVWFQLKVISDLMEEREKVELVFGFWLDNRRCF